jgi:hypothetical protein
MGSAVQVDYAERREIQRGDSSDTKWFIEAHVRAVAAWPEADDNSLSSKEPDDGTLRVSRPARRGGVAGKWATTFRRTRCHGIAISRFQVSTCRSKA